MLKIKRLFTLAIAAMLLFTANPTDTFAAETITASSSSDPMHGPENLFDSNPDTFWNSDNYEDLHQWWVSYDYGTEVTLTSYSIQSTGDAYYAPTDFRLEGYDGTEWVTLDTQNDVQWDMNQVDEVKTFSLDHDAAYSKYRLFVTDVLYVVPTMKVVQLAEIIFERAATVTASSSSGPMHGPENVFDHNPDTFWNSDNYDDLHNWWVAYDFGTPKTITSYSLQSTGDAYYAPTDFRLEGYNGTEWVTLDTQSNVQWDLNQVDEVKTFTLDNDTAYSKYRLYVTDVLYVVPTMKVVQLAEIGLLE